MRSGATLAGATAVMKRAFAFTTLAAALKLAMSRWYEGGQRELERTVASKYADFRVIAVEGANQ
jgi:hypothetical protein